MSKSMMQVLREHDSRLEAVETKVDRILNFLEEEMEIAEKEAAEKQTKKAKGK